MSEARRLEERRTSLKRAIRALRVERLRIEEEIAEAGARRQEALDQARKELELIGDLAPDALDAGSSPGELADRASISKRTLYKMLDERGYRGHRE